MSAWASTDFYQKDQKIVWSKVLMIREKLQITAAFLISAAKCFLPVQLIHEGKSKRCVPKVRFPSDFNFTFSSVSTLNKVGTGYNIDWVLSYCFLLESGMCFMYMHMYATADMFM